MQTRPGIENDTIARRTRAALALAVSLALHCGIAYAMMDAASVYGRANVPVPSLSVEAVQTIVLEEVTPTDKAEPPAESAAMQASVAAETPSPDKHVPETQIEKPEPPAAAEPTQLTAHQPPSTPAQEPPVQTRPAEATPEPPVVAPPLPTIDQPEATEVPVAKPDPEAVIDEHRQQAALRKQMEEEAQRKAEKERQRRERERLKAESEAASKRAVEEVERTRKIAEAEAAEKREAEEKVRKRRAAQQAREAKKAKGAERDQRASLASRGQKQDARGAARTTASRGDILSYAALVRARVASNKPGGSGTGGTVVVSFGVSGGGGLSYARISRSSGNSGLDQVALAAVRRSSPFPAPPDGQSHTFSVPFHFN